MIVGGGGSWLGPKYTWCGDCSDGGCGRTGAGNDVVGGVIRIGGR